MMSTSRKAMFLMALMLAAATAATAATAFAGEKKKLPPTSRQIASTIYKVSDAAMAAKVRTLIVQVRPAVRR